MSNMAEIKHVGLWIGGQPSPYADLPEPSQNVYMIGLGAANRTTRQVAEYFAERGFDGNVVGGYGFTQEWGVEASITVWTSTSDPGRLMFTIAAWLRDHGESAAYVLENGRNEYLVNADEQVELL